MAEVGDLRVKLSLDNAQFEKSITSMNRTLQAVGQEIRGLQNKGKDWGASLDGLKQKQDAYSRLLEGQQTKVRKLAAEYEKAKQETGEHSAQTEKLAVQLNKATAELNRTERELSEITSELQKQEAELKRSQSNWNQLGEKLSAVGDKAKAFGDKMTSVGKELSLKVTTPLTAMGVAVTKTAMDFEAQMDRVGAIAGATGNEVNKLSETAMHLGASTSKSAKEVAVGMEEMAAMGFEVNEIIGAMPGVIAAAEASGSDMAQTAEVMASTLNIFGKKASEASKVADVLAMTANISAANLTDMQYALKYAGPPAASLGISLEETAAAIGLMTNAGMQGEQAGTTLRGALLGLLDPSEENSKRMTAMGIAITDTEGNFVGLSKLIKNLQESMEGQTDTQKAATLAALVGKEAVSGMLTLMKAGPETIDSMTKSLENSAGASKEAADKMKDNLKGALEELGGAFETLSIQLGNILIPIIRDAAVRLQELVERFGKLSPDTQRLILAFAGIAAAIGPVLVVTGLLVSSVGSIAGALGTVSLAVASAGGMMAILGTAFTALTGPIGLTVAGLAGIGIGVGLLVKHFNESSIEIENWEGKVSESTAKAVGSFMELSNQASGYLSTLSITGQAITKEMASNITSTFAQMGQQVLAEMQADHAEQLEAISTFYANSNVLIEGEEAEILAKTASYQANKEKQVSDGNTRIAEIMNTASNEKRSLTLAEQAEINRIHATMKDNAIKYMTETQLEQKVILEAMKNNASEISAQQASEVVKNAISQKEKVIDEAEEQYEKAVAEIIKQRDEMGVISGTQAKQLIEDAKKQRDETIKAAEEMHTNVVSEAKKQAGEHVSQVEWETGEIKSKWQVMKQNVSTRMKEIGSDIKRDWSQAYSDSKKWVSDMATSVDNKFQAMGKSVGIKMNEAKDTVVTKWNEASAFLKAIDLKQVGRDIIDGLIGGIGEKLSGVKKKVEEIASNLPEWAKKILDIRSPSRVFAQIGKWISEGWAIGIEEKGNMVQNAVNDIALNAKDIAEHYVSEEKKLRSMANADIAKIETDKASKIATIEKRMHEDVAKAQRSAASKKKKTTQDDALKIQRIREDAIAKIAKLEETSSAQVEKIRSTSTKKIFDLESEMNKTLLEETKRYIDDKKSLDQLNIIEEAQIWEQSMKLFAEGTKERVKAQQEYKKATEAVNKEITAINTDFQVQINKVNDELIKQEETLTKAYEDAVDKRAKSLYSFKNLFDEFKVEIDTTGDQLLSNLGSQVQGFKLWQKEIETLSEKAIDKGLLAELREMGPNALPQLIALNKMTSTQLTQYSNLYKEKSSLARKQAETEMIGMKTDTDKQISELRIAANKQLDTLQNEWNIKIKSLTKSTATELSTLKQVGIDAGNGLLQGLASTQGALQKKAQEIANSISKTIQSALKIKSPSRVMMGFGENVGEGLIIGMEDKIKQVIDAGKKLASAVTQPMDAVSVGRMAGISSNNINNSRSYSGNTTINVYGNNPSPSEIARRNTQAQRQLAMEWGV